MTKRTLKIRYTAEEADIVADGKHVRILTEYDGPGYMGEKPKHIKTICEEQARQLHEDLGKVLQDL